MTFRCNMITDDGVKCLQKLPSLTYLDLCGTPVTDASMIPLTQALPGLKYLNFTATFTTDDSLKSLLRNCTKLEELELLFAESTIVNILVEKQSHLRTINLKGAAVSYHQV